MNHDCQCIHIPNFNETCCIRHLLEMSDYADDHTLANKYLKLFFKSILSGFKSNSIQYSTLKLDATKRLLEILTKQMCHFFMLNNLRFSKLMVNVALDTYQKTQFRSQVDIIYRTSAVYNNVACMYAKTNFYNKAITYFNHYKKTAISSLDQLIYYNNVLMVYLKQNALKGINEAIEEFNHLLFQEIEIAKKDNLVLGKSSSETESNRGFIDKCKLLSFLVYNYGIALEMGNKPKEARVGFQKGYEFSIGTLGVSSLYTNKFAKKLDTTGKKVAFSNKETCAVRKGESNVKYYRSKTPNRREDFTEKINKNMEKIIERLDQFQEKRFNTESEENNNTISKSLLPNSNSNTNAKANVKSSSDNDNGGSGSNNSSKPLNIFPSQHSEENIGGNCNTIINTNIDNKDKDKKMDESTDNHNPEFDKEKLMKYMILKIQSIISDSDTNPNANPNPKKKESTSNVPHSSPQNKIDLLNEIVKEFEEEVKMKEKKQLTKKTSVDMNNILKQNLSILNLKTNENTNSRGKSKNNTTNFAPLKSTDNNNTELIEHNKEEPLQQAKPLRIKRVFQKVLTGVNPPKQQGKFAGMVSNLLNDNQNTSNTHSKQMLGLNQKKGSSNIQEMSNANVSEDISFLSIRNNDNLIEISDDVSVSIRGDPSTTNIHNNTSTIGNNNNANTIANNNTNINNINASTNANANSNNDKANEEFGNALTFGDEKGTEVNTVIGTNTTSTHTNIATASALPKSAYLPKLDLVNQMKKLLIKIDLDETEYKYSARTFFQSTNIPIHPKQRLKENKINEEELFNQLVFLHSSNLNLNRKGHDLDQSPHLEFIRLYEDIPLIIQLTPRENSFYLTLYNKNTNLVEFNLEYHTIKERLTKMSLILGLPPFKLIQSYQSIEEFSKYFIQYISILKSSNKYKFGLSPHPIGIIVEKRIQFLFNKVTCLLDILVTSKDKARIIITNGTNQQKKFIIDCEFDRETFSHFVSTVNHNGSSSSSSSKCTTHSLDLSQLSPNGFIPKLSLRIQEILKIRHKDPSIESFDVLYNENIYYKCNIGNKLQCINTWISELGTNGCSVSYYTMKKDKMTSSRFDLTNNDFISLFGLNMSDLALALPNEKIILNQMIILSCEYIDCHNSIVLSQEKTLFTYSMSAKGNMMCSVGLFQMKNETYARLKCFNTQNGIECKRILLPNSANKGNDSDGDGDNDNRLSEDRMITLLQNETQFTKQIVKGCEELYNEDEFKPFDIFENVFFN